MIFYNDPTLPKDYECWWMKEEEDNSTPTKSNPQDLLDIWMKEWQSEHSFKTNEAIVEDYYNSTREKLINNECEIIADHASYLQNPSFAYSQLHMKDECTCDIIKSNWEKQFKTKKEKCEPIGIYTASDILSRNTFGKVFIKLVEISSCYFNVPTNYNIHQLLSTESSEKLCVDLVESIFAHYEIEEPYIKDILNNFNRPSRFIHQKNHENEYSVIKNNEHDKQFNLITNIHNSTEQKDLSNLEEFHKNGHWYLQPQCTCCGKKENCKLG